MTAELDLIDEGRALSLAIDSDPTDVVRRLTDALEAERALTAAMVVAAWSAENLRASGKFDDIELADALIRAVHSPSKAGELLDQWWLSDLSLVPTLKVLTLKVLAGR